MLARSYGSASLLWCKNKPNKLILVNTLNGQNANVLLFHVSYYEITKNVQQV